MNQSTSFNTLKDFMKDYCNLDINKINTKEISLLLDDCCDSIADYIRFKDTTYREMLMNDISYFLIGKLWPTYGDSKEYSTLFNEQLKPFRFN